MGKETKKTLAMIGSDALEEVLLLAESEFSPARFLVNLHNFKVGESSIYDSKGIAKEEGIAELIGEQKSDASGRQVLRILERKDISSLLGAYSVSEDDEPLVNSAIEYFSILFNKYKQPNFRLLFARTLSEGAFLPAENRAALMNTLKGVMGMDKLCKYDPNFGYFFPRFMPIIVLPLLKEYRDKLGPKAPDEPDVAYRDVVKGFSQDLERAVMYVRGKIESWEPSSKNLSYWECFPEKKKEDQKDYNSIVTSLRDEVKMTPAQYVAEMVGHRSVDGKWKPLSREAVAETLFGASAAKDRVNEVTEPQISVYSLVSSLGTPFSMERHGIAGDHRNSITINFGDHSNKLEVELQFDSGLRPNEEEAYLLLADLTLARLRSVSDPGYKGYVTATTKCRSFIVSGQ